MQDVSGPKGVSLLHRPTEYHPEDKYAQGVCEDERRREIAEGEPAGEVDQGEQC